MDDSLRTVVEMNTVSWARFQRDVADVSPDEVDWRPLPEANTINLIVRHLRIDAAWHVRSIERQAPDQGSKVASDDARTESIPLEFHDNLSHLGNLVARFRDVLGRITAADLQRRSAWAYEAFPQATLPDHFLAYHFALHLAGHGGQIRTLRNLYEKTRGRPARFFPDNPTFPQGRAGAEA